MRAVAVIPARFASTRFPGKPLVPLLGKPLIEHVYRRAQAARSISRVLVATDDPRIEEAVAGFDGECVMTSPDHRSGSDRLGEVAEHLDAEIIVNLQGDEPLMDPLGIDAVVQALREDGSLDLATMATPLVTPEDYLDRNIVKVVTDGRGYALYFSRSGIPHGWEPGLGGALRHIGLYAYRKEALLKYVTLPPGKLEVMENLEQLRALENGMNIRVVTLEGVHCVGVDTPGDLEKVENILREGAGGTAALPGADKEGK